MAHSTSEIRARARKIAAQVVVDKPTPTACITTVDRLSAAGVEREDAGDLADAFLKYQQAANILNYIIGLPQFKQPHSKDPVRQSLFQLQERFMKNVAPRSSAVEAKLKEFDEQRDQPADSPVVTSSIADRMRSLQEAGLSVSVPKRISRSMDPPHRPDSTLEQIASPPPSPFLSSVSTPNGVSRSRDASVSSRSSPLPNGHSVNVTKHTTGSSTRSGPPASRSLPVPSEDANDTSEPPLDLPSRIDASNTGTTLDEAPPPTPSQFAQAFPSIDDLDSTWASLSPPSKKVPESIDSIQFPSVPNGRVGITSSIPTSYPTSPLSPLSQGPSPPVAQNPSHAPSPSYPNRDTARPLPEIPSNPSPSFQSTTKALKSSIPPGSSVFPRTLREWDRAGHKVLLLDVRTREEFDKGHPQIGAVVCVEPTILAREQISSQQIESALILSPPNEQLLFNHRDKFDVVVVMDQSSTVFPTPPSPLASLTRAIFEVEFHKTLKQPPMLLVGGMNAWKKELGDTAITRHHPQTLLPATTSRETAMPPSLEPTRPATNPEPPHETRPNIASPSPVPIQRNSHVYRASRAGHHVNGGHGSSSSLDLAFRSPPTPIQYPRPTVSRTGSTGSISLPNPHSDNASDTPIPPPRASLSTSRRRSDFFEPIYTAPSPIPHPSINYPSLASSSHGHHNIISPPPIAAAPSSDRHSRHAHGAQSLSSPKPPPMQPAPPTIPSNYPIRTWPDVEIGISGLKNLGNTCYMNSVLQCLSATVQFTRFFQDGRWKSAVNMINPMGSKGAFASAFAMISSEMWRGEYTYLSPTTFRKLITQHASQFSGSSQHDAQEFLSVLLDGLHEDINRVLTRPEPPKVTPEREAELETLPPQIAGAQEWTIYRMRNDSLVVDYFQGQFRNRLQCLTCHKTSTTYNAFMYLSLPIPTVRGNGKVSLYDCLNEFVKEEVMEGTEAWNCPHCKTLRKATKQLSLSRMPPVLLIHLKRFSFNGPFTDKLETAVDYPLKNLSMTKYMPPHLSGSNDAALARLPADDPRVQEPPYNYDLYGVTNHFGNLSTGHYTAYVASKGDWLLCDDSRVAKANSRDVVGRPAYILFYKRVM